MAFSVMNNSSAMMALGENNKNTNKLAKSLKKVASGMKLNSAGDAASEYSISEKMRVQLRALEQDEQNVQNGKALLQIAENGVQSIIDELRTIREIAINAANDHNSDTDRKILQNLVEEKKLNIDDIVSNVNYNGKILLDGRYKIEYSKLSEDKIDISPVDSEYSSRYVINTPNKIVAPAIDYSSVRNTIQGHSGWVEGIIDNDNLPVTGYITDSEPTGIASYFQTTGYFNKIIVTSPGVFEIPDNFQGTVLVGNGVKINGKGKTYTNIQIRAAGQVWIEDLNILNVNKAQSVIQFVGGDNELVLLGKNTLRTNTTIYEVYTRKTENSPILDVGDGLTIYNGSSSKEGRLKIQVLGMSDSAGIGSYDNPNAYVTINSGTIGTLTMYGAGIGSSAGGQCGDITINGGYIVGNTVLEDWYGVRSIGTAAAVIGSGSLGNPNNSASVGNIFIGENATVDVFASCGAGIGSGEAHYIGYSVSAGDITIESENIISYSYYADAIGSGYSNALDDSFNGKISVPDERNYSQDYFNKRTNTTNYHLYYDYYDESKKNNKDTEKNTVFGNSMEYPLIIHTGEQSSQHLNIYINDMSSSAIGIGDVKVDPRELAVKSLKYIDDALNYTLNEITTIGAYNSRLDEAYDSIVCKRENTTSAESVIRDSDMAKEMTEYVKNNVLSQASQTMLSQANQSGSNVLSLLN